VNWQLESLTDPGKVRQHNEDSIFCNAELEICAVADGMGGHHRGDLASQTIVEMLQHYKPALHSGISLRRIESILETANTTLLENARELEAGIVASTCAILYAGSNTLVASWVGDSRIYRFRNNTLNCLTRDHTYETLFQDMRINGQNPDGIAIDPQTLTRGVGAEPDIKIEHAHFRPLPGDRYLLCTDGLYKEVADDELQQHFARSTDNAAVMEYLHALYLERGARDNLGLILLTVD